MGSPLSTIDAEGLVAARNQFENYTVDQKLPVVANIFGMRAIRKSFEEPTLNLDSLLRHASFFFDEYLYECHKDEVPYDNSTSALVVWINDRADEYPGYLASSSNGLGPIPNTFYDILESSLGTLEGVQNDGILLNAMKSE